VYTTENSDLPDNEVGSLAVDGQGNVWIGVWGDFTWGGGLAVYHEGGVTLPTDTVVGEERDIRVPSTYSLAQNVPNPFNPSTTIAYDLPQAADVIVTLYTITGQQVKVLTDGYQQAGHHTVHFDGSRLATGVYLYRLEAEGLAETKRMVLLR